MLLISGIISKKRWKNLPIQILNVVSVLTYSQAVNFLWFHSAVTLYVYPVWKNIVKYLSKMALSFHLGNVLFLVCRVIDNKSRVYFSLQKSLSDVWWQYLLELPHQVAVLRSAYNIHLNGKTRSFWTIFIIHHPSPFLSISPIKK